MVPLSGWCDSEQPCECTNCIILALYNVLWNVRRLLGLGRLGCIIGLSSLLDRRRFILACVVLLPMGGAAGDASPSPEGCLSIPLRGGCISGIVLLARCLRGVLRSAAGGSGMNIPTYGGNCAGITVAVVTSPALQCRQMFRIATTKRRIVPRPAPQRAPCDAPTPTRGCSIRRWWEAGNV